MEVFYVCPTSDTEHIDTIFKFLSHTRVNMGASIFFTAAVIRGFRSARSRGNGGTNTLHEMHVAQLTTDLLCDIPTHKTISSPGRPFSHYIRSQRLAAEMWTTMNYWENKLSSCRCYLYSFRKYLSYGFFYNKFL